MYNLSSFEQTDEMTCLCLALSYGFTMPYVGKNVDKRLNELKQIQATRRSEVAGANKREEARLAAVLNNLDIKHERNMVNMNTKLYVTKVDLVREIHKNTNPKLLQEVQRRSKHLTAETGTTTKTSYSSARRYHNPVRRLDEERAIHHGGRLYPFQLLETGRISHSSKPRTPRKGPNSSSLRQFPVLAAKYYHKEQHDQGSSLRKLKGKNKQGDVPTFESLMEQRKQRKSRSPLSVQLPDVTLPAVPTENISFVQSHVSEARPNTPRTSARLTYPQITEQQNSSTAVEASDDEILGLRNGQYFLRYSTSADEQRTERGIVRGYHINIDGEITETAVAEEPISESTGGYRTMTKDSVRQRTLTNDSLGPRTTTNSSSGQITTKSNAATPSNDSMCQRKPTVNIAGQRTTTNNDADQRITRSDAAGQGETPDNSSDQRTLPSDSAGQRRRTSNSSSQRAAGRNHSGRGVTTKDSTGQRPHFVASQTTLIENALNAIEDANKPN